MNRRDLLRSASLLLATSLRADFRISALENSAYEWIRGTRALIAEGFNPPFYPSFDYQPQKAVHIAQALHADSLRYPAAAYYAFFPTRSGYPVHPELRGDPMRETLDLCRAAGLKNIAYVPLNHPFMDVDSHDARYLGWCKRFADGRPMITEHYGFARYYEGCLNSPLREVIRAMVREVVSNYPFDVIYFDGPYQGMQHAKDYCHCAYCNAAYQRKFGKPVPDQRKELSLEDEIQYYNWMTNDVVIAFLAEIREMIRRSRDVPVLFNDTSLLSKREWRSHGIPVVDGFMFEAAETPEEKLFNLELGRSTGKVIWTYLSSHTEYNREHLKDDRVRGWFSYPVESEELLLDGAIAIGAGAGMVYWGLSRFFYQPQGPLSYESGRYVREIFDFERNYSDLLIRLESQPQAGILVGSQTIDWYQGRHFVGRAYPNYFHGAYLLLKSHSYEAQPFLDWQMSPERLARYPMIFAANVACLSDAQCSMLTDYVRNGGKLLATHLTSIADEYGRVRSRFGLEEVFGASFLNAEPVEIPDLYLQLPSGEEIPQDPQIVRFRAAGSRVLAETIDRGHRTKLGPSVVQKKVGQGEAIYIGSGLEAVYEETRMEPLRAFFGSLFSPWLETKRAYEVEFRPGLVPQLMSSNNTVILHLLADTGEKVTHLRARQHFLPLTDVRVRIRIPAGRTLRSATLMRAGHAVSGVVRDGWFAAVVPRVWIHEAVRLDLG